LICDALRLKVDGKNQFGLRSSLHQALTSFESIEQTNDCDAAIALQGFENLLKPQLLSLIDHHGVYILPAERLTVSNDNIRTLLLTHFSDGTCPLFLSNVIDFENFSDSIWRFQYKLEALTLLKKIAAPSAASSFIAHSALFFPQTPQANLYRYPPNTYAWDTYPQPFFATPTTSSHRDMGSSLC
jgi:hypothetical protein